MSHVEIVALMFVRNEEAYLPRCLERLREQGIRAAVLDNDSTDGTAAILESFSPDTVILVERAPFTGTFDNGRLLTLLASMQRTLRADWFILNSPDEVFDSDVAGETLADAIRRVDALGFTVVNFDEFVFVPTEASESYEGQAFDHLIRHYYFFGPAPMRQMRAWRNIPGISNVEDGGHRLRGPELRIYPVNMPLRHYITLGLDHFRRKYALRKFPADELARGWHYNRVNIDQARAQLPPRHSLKVMTDGPAALDRSEPRVKHFWE